MFWNKDKNFCDIHPICYDISYNKNIFTRKMRDFVVKEKYAKKRQDGKLPNIISHETSKLIKKGKGIDPTLQYNKAINIGIACNSINGMIIRPGEVFSFWRTVGNTTKRKGYKAGRSLRKNGLVAGIGGGLCNLSNTIHRLVLHSPLLVTEFHAHSDALAPLRGERVPFSSGTSVSYNYIDYRFKNITEQDVQLLVWCDDDHLYGELRSEREFPLYYQLVEEDYHFHKENGKYYQISKIYKQSIDRVTGEVVEKELVLDNHSEIMYDYDDIRKEYIREY